MERERRGKSTLQKRDGRMDEGKEKRVRSRDMYKYKEGRRKGNKENR